MLETITSDITGVLKTILLEAPLERLLIMGGVALACAFIMRRLTQVLGIAGLALILFAGVQYVYGALTLNDPTIANPWAEQFTRGWAYVFRMSAGELVGYFVTNVIGVSALYGVRRIFMRGE